MFYRTYITTFLTSTGEKIYAGQHTSKYANVNDDPYYGSGQILKAAVKKYGMSCIIDTQWFDHDTKTDMQNAEIKLITDCKANYDNCVNIHKGGTGGDTLFHSPERRKEIGAKVSKALKGRKVGPYSPERVANISKSLKGRASNRKGAKLSEETKQKLREANLGKTRVGKPLSEEQKKHLREINTGKKHSQETKNKCSVSMKKAMRKGTHWHMPLNGQLYDLWKLSNNVSGYKLNKLAIDNGLYSKADSRSLDILVKVFMSHQKK